MSEVKRWNVEPDEQDGPCSIWNVESKDGEFVLYEDYAAMQQKLDAVLAENFVLKVSRQDVVNAFDDAMNEFGMARGETAADYPAPETPATDALLNAVREEGVDIAVHELKELAKRSSQYSPKASENIHAAALYLMTLAAQLRAGAPKGDSE